MSELIDKLNRVAEATPQPMGFRTAQSAPARARMLLIASLAQGEIVAGLADRIAGADAVLLGIGGPSPEARAIQKMARSLPGIPWGRWLKDAGEKAADTIVEAGGDFVVFPADSSVSIVPKGNKAGKLLQVESSLSEGLLRAINELPVDGVLIAGGAGEAGPLTWNGLMLLQRAANLLAKPILVAVSPGVTAEELKTLWEAGVDGVVVAVGRELPTDRMKELRQATDDIARSARRKRGRTEARLPSVGMGAREEAEEEEGDE